MSHFNNGKCNLLFGLFFQAVFRMLPVVAWCCAFANSPHGCAGEEPTEIPFDIVVHGATPAGISAAIAAAEDDCRVLVVEPTHRIGGFITSGLSHTDFHSHESLSGAYWRFAKRVKMHYAEQYGPNSSQVVDCFEGTFAEPKVNILVLEQLLAEQSGVQLLRNHFVLKVDVTQVEEASKSIRSLTLKSKEGRETKINCGIVIDATYEGDLMAMAGVPWRAGREGREEYGETLAPKTADLQLQAYNFRFVMTKDPANRILPKAPLRYRRDDFLGKLESLASGKIGKVFDYPKSCIFKAHLPPLPNGFIVPRDLGNLLVPTAVSSSHVGFCALRLEPVWMSLGQAAGHAASQALRKRIPVQKVAIRELQHRLHQSDSATIYVSDVLPAHPDFAAVQWWGSLGGFHGISAMPAKPGQRGRNIHGQYFEANPGHAADLETKIDRSLLQRWKAIALLTGLGLAQLDGVTESSTRGDFIRSIYSLAMKHGLVNSGSNIPRLNSAAFTNFHPPESFQIPACYLVS